MPNEATQQVVEQIIKFTVDRSAQQQSQAALTQLQATYARMKLEAEQTNKQLETTRTKLAGLKGDEFDKASLKVVKLEEKVASLNKKLGDTATQFKKAEDAASGVSSAGDKLERVRLVGSQLRNLPSIQIPGAGIGTDAVANIIRLIGNIENLKKVIKDAPELISAITSAIGGKALGLIGSLGALAIVFALVSAETERARAAAKAELDARKAALDLLQTGTKEEIQTRLNALAKQREINEQTVGDTDKLFKDLQRGILNTFGKEGLGLQETAAVVGQASGAYQSARDAAVAARAEINKTNIEFELLAGISGLTAQTTEDLWRQEQALNAERMIANATVRDAVNALSAQMEVQRLINSGTTDELEKRKQSLSDEIILTAETVASLGEKALAMDKESEGYKILKAQIDQLAIRNDALNDTYRALSESTVAVAIKLREDAEYKKQQAKDTAATVKKYNDETAKSEQAVAEKRLGIQQKLNDILVKIASDAADAAQKTLDRLKEKRAELTKDAGRDELEAARKANFQQLENQIKFQENEVKAARTHEKSLKDIRDSAAADTEDAAFQRDFARLFEIERNKTRQINKANEEATAQGQERLEAFRSQQADAARQREFEHNERVIRLEDARVDAQAAFEAEQKQNEANRIKAINAAQLSAYNELRLLNNKHNQELSARARAITEELKLVALGGTERIKLEQQIQDALVAQARRLLSSLSGNASGGGRAVATRAFGGALAAGQASFVNDRFRGQRESFAGKSFPQGLGLFIPAKSGTVAPGAAGGATGKVINLSLTQNITGNNDEQIARISARLINETLQELVA